jgi:hypothetical protein
LMMLPPPISTLWLVTFHPMNAILLLHSSN